MPSRAHTDLQVVTVHTYTIVVAMECDLVSVLFKFNGGGHMTEASPGKREKIDDSEAFN